MKLVKLSLIVSGLALAACSHSEPKRNAPVADAKQEGSYEVQRTPAAELESCINRVASKCTLSTFVDSLLRLRQLDSTATCKINLEDSAAAVVFFDRNDIVAYDIGDRSCHRHIAQNVGKNLTEEKVFHGRIFTVTDQHQVIMVGKNACIYELLASSGDSYSAASGVSVNRDTDELVIHGSTKLSNEQIEKRIKKFYEGGGKSGLRKISCHQ